MRALLASLLVLAATPACAADLVSGWQGSWGWELVTEDPQFSYAGQITLASCKDSQCRFTLNAGNVSSLCDVAGTAKLVSGKKAEITFDDGTQPVAPCRMTLMQAAGKLEVQSEGEGCNDFCGYRGAIFGGPYSRMH